eukprot:scaffold113788_cov63-Phaeocystis_antarctica.AAC.3
MRSCDDGPLTPRLRGSSRGAGRAPPRRRRRVGDYLGAGLRGGGHHLQGRGRGEGAHSGPRCVTMAGRGHGDTEQ